MARISTSERLKKVHEEALRRFDIVQSAEHDERLQCLEDRRFCTISGAAWEGKLGALFDNRPKFEINKVALACTRIFNEWLNNRITVDFVSRSGDADPFADVLDGIYRADYQDSNGDEARDNAFNEQVQGGMGAYRLRAVYENEYDPEDERQRIIWEPIFDADSCVFFFGAKRQDKRDAKAAWVLVPHQRDAYIDEFEDDPASWPKDITQSEFDWSSGDLVYVAEYYAVEEKTETIHVFRDLMGVETEYTDTDFENDDELLEQLDAVGTVKVRQRKTKTRRVHKYLLSGGGVLEDCGYIAGKYIPIVVAYGKRSVIDGVERIKGHVRDAKDAARLKNMQVSKMAELAALSSVEKPIFTPEQMQGHEIMWQDDIHKNYPYLLLNPMIGPDGTPMPAGPIGYTKVPNIPPAMAALLQMTEADMQEILGANQQAEKMVSNISGKAVQLIQERLDMQTYIYMANMSKAVKMDGLIWYSMAQEVYADRKKMKAVGVDGASSVVDLRKPSQDEKGNFRYVNDFGKSDMDVVVNVGPSTATKRSGLVRDLTSLLAVAADPETQQILQGLVLMNMEGEGMADVNKYARKRLVMQGVIKPTEEEAQQMAEAAQGQPQDPQAVFMQAAAEEATAKAAKARADTVETIAAAELKQAQTAEIMAGIGQEAAQSMPVQQAQPQQMQQMQPQQAPPDPRIDQMEQVLSHVLQYIEKSAAHTDEAQAAMHAQMCKLAEAMQAPKEDDSGEKMTEMLKALADIVKSQPAPVTNVVVEKGGSVTKEMVIKSPSGDVYRGTVKTDEE